MSSEEYVARHFRNAILIPLTKHLFDTGKSDELGQAKFAVFVKRPPESALKLTALLN
jgi:hypothetical protein